MSMKFYGRLYRFSRFLVRRFYPTYRIIDQDRLEDPSVFLCRHYNTQGVLMTVPWLPGRFRIWALSLYHDRQSCYHHVMNYTLTKRFACPRWIAWFAAVAIAMFIPALVRSSRAIPVYRNSMRIMRTYQLSLEALQRGESILIFPDRAYTSTDRAMGEMYDGFFMIDRLYFRATGQHVRFVPLYADAAARTICVGEPVLAQGNIKDPAERRRVYMAIREQLSGPSPGQE